MWGILESFNVSICVFNFFTSNLYYVIDEVLDLDQRYFTYCLWQLCVATVNHEWANMH